MHFGHQPKKQLKMLSAVENILAYNQQINFALLYQLHGLLHMELFGLGPLCLPLRTPNYNSRWQPRCRIQGLSLL